MRILLILGIPALVAASVSPVGTQSATIALSSYRASIRPVVLTVRVHYEMQCAWPGQGPLTIRLPDAMTVPSMIPPSAILINGNAVTHLGGAHRVELDLPPRPQILCDAIAPGTLVIRFTRAALLGNPKTAGTYRLHATKGSLAFAATLHIRK